MLPEILALVAIALLFSRLAVFVWRCRKGHFRDDRTVRTRTRSNHW